MAGALSLGIDSVVQAPGTWLRGRRFGLVTNAGARTSAGVLSHVALAAAAPGLLAAMFAPEHGLDVNLAAGEPVADARTPDGICVHSLYAADRFSPRRDAIRDLDLLLVDLVDVGCRYYTYAATLIECLQAAAAQGLPVMVLDRPNPLGGTVVEGPGVLPGYRSLVGPMDTPPVHGLTIAELARLAANSAGLPSHSLEIVPLTGWDAADDWDATGLTWYRPSPAATSPAMPLVYPGTCLLEGTNVSEGRGTAIPFEVLGAPWIDGELLADAIAPAARALGWSKPVPAQFVPAAGIYAGQPCGGVRLIAGPQSGRRRPLALGVAILCALARLYRRDFAWLEPPAGSPEPRRHIDLLAGGAWLREAVAAGYDWRQIAAAWAATEREYIGRVSPLLLYDRQMVPASESRPPAEKPRAVPPARPGHRHALDRMDGTELAALIIDAAQDALATTRAAIPAVGAAIEAMADRLAAGGRLIYAGAGTSGRLGVLDASECAPTFGVSPDQAVGLLAGGPAAVAGAVEDAEDDRGAGAAAIAAMGVGPTDALIGISASGNTPYTVAAISEARRRGALTVAVVARPGSPMAAVADIAIETLTGEEPLRGSTRLKAGTAHKVVLNALSTGAFARSGYVYDDWMVGVQPANAKLRARATEIVASLAGVDQVAAQAALTAAMTIEPRAAVRIAILSLVCGIEVDAAARRLKEAGGALRRAMGSTHDDPVKP